MLSVPSEALLAEAVTLFRSLTPVQRCEALKAFRVIRQRVPKPKTGPLQLPAPGMSASK